jgi:PKD repeat protein
MRPSVVASLVSNRWEDGRDGAMKRRLLAVGVLVVVAGAVLAGCSLLRVSPSVDFVASSVEGRAPLVVEFSPLVEGAAVSYAWSFGDGATSTEASPLHVYADAGTYSVMLTVEFANHEPVALIKKRFVTAGEPLRTASPSYLYWITERGSSIKRGAPTGGPSEKLASQTYFPVNMDIGCGKVFWVTTRSYGGMIDYMDLDGSNWVAALGEHNRMEDIAVDVRNEKVYWTCWPEWPYDGALKRANLDFTHVEILMVYPTDSHTHPGPVVVDSESQTVYWSETAQIGQNSQTMILASPTTGFAPYDVMEIVGPPRDMALDTLPGFGARNLYYTVGWFELRRARLDGTSDVTVLSELDYPWGVAVDPYTGRIYVGTYDGIFFTDDGATVHELYPNEVGVRSVVLSR